MVYENTYENTQEIKIRLRKEEVKALVKWLIENNYDVWKVLDLLRFDNDGIGELFERLYKELEEAVARIVRSYASEEIYDFVREHIVIDEENLWHAVYAIYAFSSVSAATIVLNEYVIGYELHVIETLKKACAEGVIRSSCDVIETL
ncbi:MAG: hypothetical protein QXT13_12625 [Pyrobaculum sp.]